MTLWLLRHGAAQFTTAIARMLGKAVKVRHCPATVSASASVAVGFGSSDEGRNSARVFPPSAEGPTKPLEASPLRPFLGRWLEKAQVRRPVPGAFNPLAFRGERRSHHACFRICARSPEPRAFLHVHSHSVCRLRSGVPGCVDPRRGDRPLGGQGYRRRCGSAERRKSCCVRGIDSGRELSDSDRGGRTVFSGGFRQKLQAVGDPGVLRREAGQH